MAEQISQLQRQGQLPVTQGTETETEIFEAMKQQIQICTDDFESERKDREKVESKLHGKWTSQKGGNIDFSVTNSVLETKVTLNEPRRDKTCLRGF